MDDRQKKHLLSNLAEAMQDVAERSQARRLVHFYKADPAYGCGIARKLDLDMEEYIPWTKLWLKDLAEKTA